MQRKLGDLLDQFVLIDMSYFINYVSFQSLHMCYIIKWRWNFDL